ncbi:MAG TPA: MBL fold metallo-hydrolase [Armatimonadota bacterium]|jgi:competence protein ComEC
MRKAGSQTKTQRTTRRGPVLIGIIVLLIAAFTVARVFQHGHFRLTPSRDTAPLGPATLTIRVLDVGQGDAILLRLPDQESLLIDAGDQAHSSQLVAAIRAAGISRLNLLVATHPHEDHIGGMAAVFNTVAVDEVWDSGYNQGSHIQERFLQTIRTRGIHFATPRRGYLRTMGGVQLEVLAPAQLLSGTDSDANNNSLVIRITFKKFSALLTGDMESAEREGISDWTHSTILKVAHHGSRNGTDGAFLAQVQPELALISVGDNNEYRHPHPETLRALRAASIPYKATATDGTITVTTDGAQFTVTSDRQSANAARSASGSYIGNLRSLTFHRPTCERLPAAHNRVYFATRADAIRQGYHPCSRCHP